MKKIKMNTKIKSEAVKKIEKGSGFLGIFVMLAATLTAQTAPKPDPEVLELNDGERLIGHFVSASGASLTFHSDAAGDVKVDWAKVKSLKSFAKFAVVEKGIVLNRHTDLTKIPQGTISASDQKLAVDPGNGATPTVVPVADATNVVPQPDFLAAFKTPRLDQDWHGVAGLGIDLIDATQDSRNITANIALQRVVSDESWIDPRYKTIVTFNVADSQLSQSPASLHPTITTDLVHGTLEHDMFLSNKLFAYVSADFLHSSSQGMELQQTYGGGIGYVVLKNAHQELDVKAAVDYIRQSFATPTQPAPPAAAIPTPPDKSLIGASLGESFTRTFKSGVAFHEGLTVIPAFNDAKYYTASAFANFAIPVYKRINITIGGLDNYVNQPPSGFKTNSFEFVTQLAYKIN
jgi:hypothetical protein